MTRFRAACVALCLLTVGCDVRIQRGDMPEPPPPDVAGKGMAPGYHLVRLPSREAVDKLCREWGVDPADDYNRRLLVACVIPGLKAVVMPAEGLLEPKRDKAVLEHEYAHTWDYRHKSGGRDWVKANALMTPQATALNALKDPR